MAKVIPGKGWHSVDRAMRVIPAMAAGISKKLLSWETIIELVDQVEQKALVAKRSDALRLKA